MELVSYPTEPLAPRLVAILGRHSGGDPQVEEVVAEIIAAVRREGDRALIEFTERFDGVRPTALAVPKEEIARALDGLDGALRQALEEAAANIRRFHEHQRTNSWFMEDGDGVILGKKVIPIDRVGLCVPGGQAPLISSLLMAAVPAQVAGVGQICLVSPPQADGWPHRVTLAAAGLLGLEEVYAVGGAQAVGAMAYGTESIRAVDKIVGPGSQYTVAAKRQVFGKVGIEMIPGPSEIAILADDGADPGFVAADLISQAEHGTGFEAAVGILTSRPLAQSVQREVENQLAVLPRAAAARKSLDGYGALVLVPDLETGVELLNRIAPEHAELLVGDPWAWQEKVKHCGALFLGPASTEPVGDYFAGTNHVLPTNGAARYASSLGLADFVKTTSIVAYSQSRLRQVGERIVRLAQAEGLEGHAEAVRVRLRAWEEHS